MNNRIVIARKKLPLSRVYGRLDYLKLGCIVLLFMPPVLVSANTIHVDNGGMVLVYSDTNSSNSVAPSSNESASAASVDA